jgi:flagellar basal-body rod protein FlgG
MAPQEIGPIELVDFINEGGLEPIGDNLYLETNASGAPIVAQAATDGMGSIDQGALEASNVNVVEELVKLIQIQRS